MGSLALAFSVHHFITSVGADAGFAAIVGLALLVLLFFAQARETSTLREQAYESAQRVQQLEARLAQLLSRPQTTGSQTTAPPAPAPPGVARPLANRVPSATAAGTVGGAVAGGAVAATGPGGGPSGAGNPGVPVAPAGVAAPALTAATKLIPTPVSAPTPAGVAGPEPVAAPVGAAEPFAAPAAGAGAAAAAGAGAAAPAAGAGAAAAAGAGAAAPAAGAAAAAPAATAVADPPIDATEVGSLPPVTAAGNGAGRAAAPSPVGGGEPPYDAEADGVGRTATVGPPPPRAQIRPTTKAPIARRSSVPPGAFAPPATRASRGARVLVGVLGVLVVAGVVAALLILTSSNSTNVRTHTTARNSNVPASRDHKAAAPARFNPSIVTVAVLNGTSSSALASRVAAKLVSAGYKQGTVTNGANQTQTATVVAYMPGARQDALEVASALKLGSASVQAIDSSTRAIACPSTSCSANVVVTVGQDLASSA